MHLPRLLLVCLTMALPAWPQHVLIATGLGGNGVIGVADVLKGGPSTFLQTGADQPTSVAVSRDGTHVYAALSATESIDYINVATGAIDAQIAVPGGSAQSLGISPDGNRLYASFEGDGALIRSNV